jgi:hypothetical protein
LLAQNRNILLTILWLQVVAVALMEAVVLAATERLALTLLEELRIPSQLVQAVQ